MQLKHLCLNSKKISWHIWRNRMFFFAPNKIITTGQGGIVITNNSKIYKSLLRLKDQGRIKNKTQVEHQYLTAGFNFKFTNLQAALGISQLKTIKKE